MRHDIRLPELEDATEVFVVEWFVDVGDSVSEGQAIIEVVTDKANIDVEADVAGTLTERCVEPEQRVATGDLLAIVEAT